MMFQCQHSSRRLVAMSFICLFSHPVVRVNKSTRANLINVVIYNVIRGEEKKKTKRKKTVRCLLYTFSISRYYRLLWTVYACVIIDFPPFFSSQCK